MPTIHTADALFRGANPVRRAFLGDTLVWNRPDPWTELSPSWLRSNADLSSGSLPGVETFDGRECLAIHAPAQSVPAIYWRGRYDFGLRRGPMSFSFDLYSVGVGNTNYLSVTKPTATTAQSTSDTECGGYVVPDTTARLWGKFVDGAYFKAATVPLDTTEQWITCRTEIRGDGTTRAAVTDDQGALIVDVEHEVRGLTDPAFSLWLYMSAGANDNTDTYISNVRYRLEWE